MFENRIGYWIDERGMKLKHLAKKLDVSYQTISNWKNNRSVPDIKQAYYLSRVLSVTLEDLFHKEE